MLSCDTIALGRTFFVGNQNLLGKNSDRPLGEAQPLAWFPGSSHIPGEILHCTHLTIPQAETTYSVLGSKPYWIWGFEMGANEKGLFIGNEAQGSRCPAEREEGLLGMDMLRLALERAATAQEAIDVITALLEQYGQNANASALVDRRYENSFMIVDREEIWLLETAGRQWAAKKMVDWAATSNCYTIGAQFQRSSERLESCAREMRLLGDREPFDFARAYSAPASRQTHAVPRKRRLDQLITQTGAPLSDADLKRIFRDHLDGTILTPRFGPCYGGFVTICMHALTWDASQTAASMLLRGDDELGVICRYAPSMPCCSVYLPVYWTGRLPHPVETGGANYEDGSLWWVTERLAMAVSVDEDRFGPTARDVLRELEERTEQRALDAEAQARNLIRAHRPEEAAAFLQVAMESSADEMLSVAAQLGDAICRTVNEEGGAYGPRKEFLEAYSSHTGMPLFAPLSC